MLDTQQVSLHPPNSQTYDSTKLKKKCYVLAFPEHTFIYHCNITGIVVWGGCVEVAKGERRDLLVRGKGDRRGEGGVSTAP